MLGNSPSQNSAISMTAVRNLVSCGLGAYSSTSMSHGRIQQHVTSVDQHQSLSVGVDPKKSNKL